LVVGIPLYLGCKYIPDENPVNNLLVQTADTETTDTVTKHEEKIMAQRLPSRSENEENEDVEDMSVVSTMQCETRLGDSTGRFDALTSMIYGTSKRSLYKKDKCNYGQAFVLHVALGVNFILQPSLGKMVAMILQIVSQVVVRCHIERNSLNLVTLRSPDVLPVPHGNSMSDDEGNIHHGVLDTDAPVGSTSEDKVISGIRLSRAIRI